MPLSPGGKKLLKIGVIITVFVIYSLFSGETSSESTEQFCRRHALKLEVGSPNASSKSVNAEVKHRLDELHEEFLARDADKSGKLDLAEFQQLMAKRRVSDGKASGEELAALFASLDADKGGSVSFRELSELTDIFNDAYLGHKSEHVPVRVCIPRDGKQKRLLRRSVSLRGENFLVPMADSVSSDSSRVLPEVRWEEPGSLAMENVRVHNCRKKLFRKGEELRTCTLLTFDVPWLSALDREGSTSKVRDALTRLSAIEGDDPVPLVHTLTVRNTDPCSNQVEYVQLLVSLCDKETRMVHASSDLLSLAVGIEDDYLVALVVAVAGVFFGLLILVWLRSRAATVHDPVFRDHFALAEGDADDSLSWFEVENECGEPVRVFVPREVLQAHVFSYLDVRSLGRASQVNRAWNKVGVDEIRTRLTASRLHDWRAVARDARSALPLIRSELHSRRRSILLFLLLPLILALLVIVTLHVDYDDASFSKTTNVNSLSEVIILMVFLLIWRFLIWPLIQLAMSLVEPPLRFVAIVVFGHRFEDLEHRRTTSVLLGGTLMTSVVIMLLVYYVLLAVINWRRFTWERKKRILLSLQSDRQPGTKRD